MTVTFVFWNLRKRPLQDHLVSIVANFGVDVVILAECEIDVALLAGELTAGTRRPFVCPANEGRKITIATSFQLSAIVDQFDDPIGGLTIKRLNVGKQPGILLAAVHLPSRVNWDSDDLSQEATRIASDIAETEQSAGNWRTVLVGDLNMNPFDAGVVGGRALHAVMTKAIVEEQRHTSAGTRGILQTSSNTFFYNPMWGCFGDRTDGPAGTYFLHSSKPINHFWNMYDQVLLRPELMHALTDLHILDTDGARSLVSPSLTPGVSDHLPVLFSLDL